MEVENFKLSSWIQNTIILACFIDFKNCYRIYRLLLPSMKRHRILLVRSSVFAQQVDRVSLMVETKIHETNYPDRQ